MPRRVQDIIPNDRRSIRDIPISREKGNTQSSRIQAEKKTTKIKGEIQNNTTNDEMKNGGMRRMAMTPPLPKRKSFREKGMWLLVAFGVIAAIIVLAFVASTFFSRAVFSIAPKIISVSVNNTLVIKPGTSNDLTYEVITLKSSEETTVSATDGPLVSTKAEGFVNVYNAYSSSSVRLIAGTRLSDDSGRIYRLKNSIVIPAYSKSSGSIVPGSIRTSIIADQPGVEYNITRSDAISDFKIVAYKGSSRYETIYGRLVSDVVGGMVGTKKVVNATVLASTTAALKSKLLSGLLEKAKTSIPDGYIMYDSSYTSSFGAPTISGNEKNQAKVTIQGTVYGIIFEKASLTAKLAGAQAVTAFGDFGYTTPGLEKLSFSISNIKDFAPDKKGTLIINIKGEMKLVGTIPVDELKNDLAGKSLAESQNVLKSFAPVIENADGELVPPWSKIPSDTSRITINIKGYD